MTTVLAGAMATLAVTALLVPLVRVARRRPAQSPFRRGPLFAWCPAEARETPHTLDVGVRRCRSCKTSTPTTTSEEKTHG
ncbi:hypothetical protein [Streptomyces sp. A1136]|uniref:hypothetical protein n=1 Tax=Streptomyces sp. A1136 TaxID=2563102 RepID=UPI00109EAAF9|nr:hypothetical protein [Streptomyces sp. A1136]THA50825.1 hypothetical protein E6R62_24055 [Streptomyces sp. A1136]